MFTANPPSIFLNISSTINCVYNAIRRSVFSNFYGCKEQARRNKKERNCKCIRNWIFVAPTRPTFDSSRARGGKVKTRLLHNAIEINVSSQSHDGGMQGGGKVIWVISLMKLSLFESLLGACARMRPPSSSWHFIDRTSV